MGEEGGQPSLQLLAPKARGASVVGPRGVLSLVLSLFPKAGLPAAIGPTTAIPFLERGGRSDWGRHMGLWPGGLRNQPEWPG